MIQAGVSKVFNDADPVLTEFLSKFNIPLDLLNQSLADMADKKLETKQLAQTFLKQHPEVWKKWVAADVAAKVSAGLK